MDDDAHVPTRLLERFDADLQTFYRRVVARELDVSDPFRAADVRRALREVTNAYRKETVSCHASSIRYDTPEKRCAYVIKHCPCFSSAVAKHFFRWMRADPIALREAVLYRRRINLCCLGGGPATDAVGVAKVVHALNEAIPVRNYASRLLLKVAVVDLSEDWRTTAAHVLCALQEDGDFCNPERMLVEFEFLGADLTEPWAQPLREVLSEADIVTTVYFVSAVNGSRAGDKCLRMLQDIMESLKPGALFFFLDTTKDINFGTVFEAAGSTKGLKQSYGPRLQCFHTLSMASVRQFIRLYFAAFRALLCLTNCFVASCGWVKGGTTHAREAIRAPQWHSGRRWQKIVDLNTRRQADYRERVERLLLSELDMEFAADDEPDGFCGPECPTTVDGKVFNASKAKRKRIYAWCE